jgi:predicted  nucleic acid-binding Zn-ribbon protein
MNAIVEVLSNISIQWGSLLLCIVVLWTFSTVKLSRFYSRFQTLENEVREIKPKFKELEVKMDQRFAKIDQRFEKIDQRIAKIDQRFEKMENKLDKLNDKLDNIAMYLLDDKPEHLRKTK